MRPVFNPHSPHACCLHVSPPPPYPTSPVAATLHHAEDIMALPDISVDESEQIPQVRAAPRGGVPAWPHRACTLRTGTGCAPGRTPGTAHPIAHPTPTLGCQQQRKRGCCRAPSLPSAAMTASNAHQRTRCNACLPPLSDPGAPDLRCARRGAAGTARPCLWRRRRGGGAGVGDGRGATGRPACCAARANAGGDEAAGASEL